MAYDPREGFDHGNEADWPVTNGTTHEQGDPILLNTSAGTTVVATAAASRRFVGWMTGPGGSITGNAGLTNKVRTYVGQGTKTNVLIVGTGASDTLTAADRGKDVFVTGANAYTVVPAANQVRVGTLSKIRSAGTSADGRGDIHWEGLASEAAGSAAGSGTNLVDLTDSTGDSGTHDDTLADGLTTTAFTADNGGATADNTVEAMTGLGVALDPSNMDDGSANNVLVAIGDTSMGNESSNIEQNFDKLVDEINTLITLTGALANNIQECVDKIQTITTDLGVQNQNDSDLAQKIKEIVAILEANNLAV